MDRSERFYLIRQRLGQQRSVSTRQLLDELEVSPATLKRDIQYLRDRFQVPIDGMPSWAATPSTGRGRNRPVGTPGHVVLRQGNPRPPDDAAPPRQPRPRRAAGAHVEPLVKRLDKLLGAADDAAEEVRRRVLIVGIGKRSIKLAHFEKVGSALLRRKRLSIRYFARGRGEESQRQISPQRLVHYRENWYLDAWCHLRGGLRNFAVDSIRDVELLDSPARDVPQATLDAVLGPGYGIFAGDRLQWATLRFSPERSRWVAAEFWHPAQKGRFEADGRYARSALRGSPRAADGHPQARRPLRGAGTAKPAQPADGRTGRHAQKYAGACERAHLVIHLPRHNHPIE
jgi:predicted DNA-binding transcriptional regulator YafY